MPQSIGSPLLWTVFVTGVLFLLVLDLGVFHRHAHAISSREALSWTLVWIAMALFFNLGVWRWFGPQKGLEFLTGYLIEKALSIDNIFVFMVIFNTYAVPAIYQHRVLFWGILGAIVMRGIFILAGATLIHRFQWIIFCFGAFLVITGVRFLVQKETQIQPERNPILTLIQRIAPFVLEYHGPRFMVVKEGRRYATLLMLVLIIVELTDMVFAVDSIPAVFAITTDPFIVYTSNIFAILGLRALYFLLVSMIGRFHYLKIGLGWVLVFVGVKMLIHEHFPVPIGWSLLIISLLLGLSILASLFRPAPSASSKPAPQRS